jgi:hypothetical protein
MRRFNRWKPFSPFGALVLAGALVSTGCGEEGIAPEAETHPRPELQAQELAVSGDVTEVVLEPEADSFVRSDRGNTNYGGYDYIETERVSYTSYSFLRFNLGSLPSGARITSAVLEATAYMGTSWGGDGNVYTYLVPNDGWGEGTITWGNQPATQGSSLGSWWLWYSSSSVRFEQRGANWSPALVAPVQEALDTDRRVSFRLHSPGYGTAYRSREYPVAAVRPRLTLRYLQPRQTVELTPVADATVDATSPESNFGADTSFSVDPASQQTYLRFNLGAIPGGSQVFTASLSATAFSGWGITPNDEVDTFLVPDDTWSETGITWNTKPAISGHEEYSTSSAQANALGSWMLNYSGGRFFDQMGVNASPKLAAPVQSALGSDGLISFRLSAFGYTTNYYSREAPEASRRPKLTVQYLYPPVPALLKGVALEAVADAVVDVAAPNTNAGTGASLAVDQGKKQTYLRFNLSSIPAGAHIADVLLSTTAHSSTNVAGNGNVYTYLVPDDTWSETGLTWNNKPMPLGGDLGSWFVPNLPSAGSTPHTQPVFNRSKALTSVVQEALDSDGRISFQLNASGSKTEYRSREHNEPYRKPTLLVYYFE